MSPGDHVLKAWCLGWHYWKVSEICVDRTQWSLGHWVMSLKVTVGSLSSVFFLVLTYKVVTLFYHKHLLQWVQSNRVT